MSPPILVAQRGADAALIQTHLLPALANSHGLITGATGTGKTITLQTLAEGFSAIGVPVVLADVKGDLSGITQAGQLSQKVAGIVQERGLPPPTSRACPATLWDVFGEQGHPVRATITDMGPLLLGRLLGLNETQQGVLAITFKLADDMGLALLDLKDLRAMLADAAANAREHTTSYGNISAASVGAIQRALLQVQEQGGAAFFGEPMLNIADLMQTVDGHGVVNVLVADKLLNAPRLYATVLLWMLSELFETLPEVGDLDKPKLVFFFDEAHLLFADAPKVLMERIELVVRLVRSKGVGVYFVTQNPLDVPDSVLAQLGNRVQHALRAFTPRDQKAVKAAADTMRPNPALGDMAQAITELAVGEALVSFLDDKGRPSVTERVFVLPPGSQIGPITPDQRHTLRASSLVAGVYEQAVDRDSAYERLKGRAAAGAPASDPGPTAAPTSGPHAEPTASPSPSPATRSDSLAGALKDAVLGSTGPRGGRQAGLLEKAATSAVRSMGTAVGRQIIRGVLGSLLGGSRRR